MGSSLPTACVALFVAFLIHPTHAQGADDVQLRSERIVKDLASVQRYDSDLSMESGVWLSRFVHLRLSRENAVPEAVFLSFDPRLLAQVAEVAQSSSGTKATIEFQEYRFPIAMCEGLSAEIGALQAALSAAIGSVGQRPRITNSEIILDGRYYGLNVRVDGYSEGHFDVNENEHLLFGPIDAIVRSVEQCSKGIASQRRAYDF